MLHWFEYSEQADALSIVAAVLGAGAGSVFADRLARSVKRFVVWLPLAAVIATLPYLMALPVVRGWKLALVSRSQIEHTLASEHWLPFYYHYFTSEANAVASLLSVAVSMVPLGGIAWAVRSEQQIGKARSLVPVTIAALCLSLLLEVGALITTAQRPDPTNVLIAIGAAILGQRACEWLARTLGEMSDVRENAV